MSDLIGLFVIVFFLVLFGSIGLSNEKKSFAKIDELEKKYSYIKLYNTKAINFKPEKFEMVYGDCVVATDYFKMVMAGLKSIFGGRLTSYETLIDRAKRMAICRMLEMADSNGFSEIYNLRIETNNIGRTSGNNGNPAIEIFVYGTAVK
ncbi:MAG: heavy metal-binding domain-containing protein [Candidatus Muiribacteriota bacterium]